MKDVKDMENTKKMEGMRYKKGAITPQNAAWLIAVGVMVLAVLLFQHHTGEKKEVTFKSDIRDSALIENRRELPQLLQTPVLVEGNEMTIAELFAYREIDPSYEQAITGVLARYAPNTLLTLKSGTDIISQYGRPLEGEKYLTEAQIPSLTGTKKPLVVTIETAPN